MINWYQDKELNNNNNNNSVVHMRNNKISFEERKKKGASPIVTQLLDDEKLGTLNACPNEIGGYQTTHHYKERKDSLLRPISR